MTTLSTPCCRSLSLQQRVIVEIVRNHLRKTSEQQLREAILLNISGTAGTGKTLLCTHLRQLLEDHSRQHKDFQYVVAAYTGIAAHQVRGETLHHAFGIPLYIKDDNIEEFINNVDIDSTKVQFLRQVKFFIFDEMSFIGQKMFYLIDRLIKKYAPKHAELPFAGWSVVLVGDIYQLGPIGDRNLFNPASNSHSYLVQESYKLYRSFQTVFVLKTLFRQTGRSVVQVQFQEFLGRLRKGECNDTDVEYVRGRLEVNIPEEQVKLFEYVLHAFPRRSHVTYHNWKMLRKQFAEHERVVIDNEGKSLEVAIGCPVILLRNLDVKGGLCNGTRGNCEDIVMREGKTHYILVSFPDFTGVYQHVSPRGKSGIPIYRMNQSVYCPEMERYIQIKRFPLELCYALTVHRIQGLTLPSIAIHLGPYQMFPAMDFISFSRTRNMTDILILDKDVSADRLKCIRKPKLQMWEEARLMTMERIDFNNICK